MNSDNKKMYDSAINNLLMGSMMIILIGQMVGMIQQGQEKISKMVYQ